MDQAALESALATAVPPELAEDLVEQFLEIRRDVATGTLGRASPGKFVETVVQVLQALENGGKYDTHPKVDSFLKGIESRPGTLPDGLRICAARLVARCTRSGASAASCTRPRSTRPSTT
jgi:hypothetical protein